MPDWQDHYLILGVDRNANQQEIKEKYKFKAFTQHPDRLTEAPESVRRQAEEELKKLNVAYEILRDPKKRAQYNSEWDNKKRSDAGKETGRRNSVIKPKPIVDPKDIFYDGVEAGKIKSAFFIIRNEGGPYDKLWFGNPDSWVKVVNWTSINSNDQLPLKVEIEAQGKEWDKRYVETIKVKLDEEESIVKIELRTASKPLISSEDIKKTKDFIQNNGARTAIAFTILIFFLFWFVGGFSNNNKLPEISSLTSNVLSPKDVGSIIEWTVEASDPDDDPILYRYFLDGKPQAYWSANKNWTWDSGGSIPGKHKIEIWIRDGKHSSEGRWDSSKAAEFTLTAAQLPPNYKPLVNDLVANKDSPQNAGKIIEWTAFATDPESDQIYYKFWLKGTSTYNEWQIVRDWSISDAWIWKTSVKEVGYYQIAVDVRDGNHAAQDDHDAELVENFELNNPPTLSVKLNPDEPSPQNSGAVIIWRATTSESGTNTIYYRFLLNGPSTSNAWKIMEDWSASNTWSWMTSSLDVGDNKIEVQVRLEYAEDTEKFDAEDTSSYTISSQLSPSSQRVVTTTSSEKTPSISTTNQPEIQGSDKLDKTVSPIATSTHAMSNPPEKVIDSTTPKPKEPKFVAETPSKHSGAIIADITSKFSH